MKLSIIVPVFKVEKYIEKCLVSLLKQNIEARDYEIIVINDGSPDNSKKIIQQFVEKHENIIFIDQENQGVSVARNQGLEIARGEYVLFVDPDDSIQAYTLNEIYLEAKTLNLDILYLKLDGYNEEGMHELEYESCGTRNVILEGLLHERRTFPATLYSRKVINDIRFVPGIARAQDTVFNAMVHSLAKRVSYLDIPFYKYLHRPSSSKQFINSKRVFGGCLLGITVLLSFRTTRFSPEDKTASLYFDKVVKLFMIRILQWNILPDLNRRNFVVFRRFVKQTSLERLLDEIAKEYLYVNKNYLQFYMFHKLYRLKKLINA